MLELNETERQLLVLSLKIMMNVLHENNSPYAPHIGVMSAARRTADRDVASKLRTRLKLLVPETRHPEQV